MPPIRGNMALEIKLWNISINIADRTGKVFGQGWHQRWVELMLDCEGKGGIQVELRPCDVSPGSLWYKEG